MDEKTLNSRLAEWRQDLHRHPETAFEEVRTAAFVAEKLREIGLDVHTGIGGTGVVANLKLGGGKRTIGLRADMDAICLGERSSHSHVSLTPGKMHACGHDGHTVTLMGAAMVLAQEQGFDGTVRFIFQPAEEPGKGAQAMIGDGLFERFPVDEIYGMHNMPSLPAGVIGTRAGGITASEDNFAIRITGRGGHASSPHLGVDPLACACEIYLALQTIVSRNASPLHPVVVSCTEFHTDGAHNAIPTHVEILGDTRSCSPKDQALIEERMRAVCEHICQMNGAACDFTYTHEFYPVVNDEACAAAAFRAAVRTVGEGRADGNCEPWMASEDFAAFLREVPGAFLFLGSGRSENPAENTPLHNAEYDYNDSVLATGAQFWAALVRERLGGGKAGES